jgi:RND family efflux transporter MFP subunit
MKTTNNQKFWSYSMNFSNIRNNAKVITFACFIALTLTSCLKDKPEPPKSMEQIKAADGIPVTITEIIPTGFTKELSYFSTLSGYKESVERARVSDQILKINAKVGDFVRENQVIMEFPSNNPVMQYEQAKAALDNAATTLKRMKELLDAGEISQQMVDNTNTQYIVAKRNFEQMNQIIAAKAPISGTIISMPVRVGDVPKFEAVLFTVAITNKMIAKVNISDREIGMIKKGMPADVTWNGNVYRGTVSLIGLELSPLTRSFPVEIVINNPKNELKSGITVDVSIKIADDNNVIALDRKFILDEEGKKFVFIEDGGFAKKRQISTGKESGVMVEITNGIQPGDRLISCCTTFLEDGSKIKIESMGNK